ncbi:hypothetical protein [Streptomyces montanus]|uniref:hypothetical protein n=1 Tax=Streptomyces montanus TaxID=2580423 RepID=UPI001FEB62D7|nr:hypothetical protein [Streptomyces montanus]
MSRSTTPPVGRISSPDEARTDYAGAVYGSLLAASVLATATTLGDYPRLELVLVLLVTGLVFWATHVYARLAGERPVGRPWRRGEIRRVALHEWPIVQAAALPAAVVAVSPLLGLDLNATEWLALGVAVAQQVFWASLGAVHSGARRGQMIAEGAVNLLLGLIIVAAKAALSH